MARISASGRTILSPNSRTVVPVNTRLTVRDFGTSINFDGVNGSRVTLASVLPQIDLTKSFTFSCWCNPSKVYAGNLFTQYDTTINSVFAIGLQSTQIRARLRNISGASDVGSASSGNAPIKPNNWSNIVYTWDTSTAKLYINNSLQVGTTANTVTSTTDQIAYIGARNNGQNVWNGGIDQVRIWNKALSATEVQNLYLKGTLDRTTLTNEYLMNEGSGATTSDAVGGITGTLAGGAAWATEVPMKSRLTA